MKKYTGTGDPIKFAHKELYNTATQLTMQSLRKDAEEVKAVRDAYTETYFGKNYKSMSYEEISQCIDKMRSKVKVSSFITDFQKKKLWLEMIRYALYYADFKSIVFVDKETGEIFTGTELKENMQMLFENKESLPQQVVNALCKKCINTKSNRFLIEGNFKLYSKAENNLDYRRLSYDAANYLIERYQAVNKQFEIRENYTKKTSNTYEFELN